MRAWISDRTVELGVQVLRLVRSAHHVRLQESEPDTNTQTIQVPGGELEVHGHRLTPDQVAQLRARFAEIVQYAPYGKLKPQDHADHFRVIYPDCDQCGHEVVAEIQRSPNSHNADVLRERFPAWADMAVSAQIGSGEP